MFLLGCFSIHGCCTNGFSDLFQSKMFLFLVCFMKKEHRKKFQNLHSTVNIY